MMNVYEKFALQEYVSEYPEGKTFHEILEMIENDSEDILLWDPFVYMELEVVSGLISELAQDLQMTFYAKEEMQEIISSKLKH